MAKILSRFERADHRPQMLADARAWCESRAHVTREYETQAASWPGTDKARLVVLLTHRDGISRPRDVNRRTCQLWERRGRTVVASLASRTEPNPAPTWVPEMAPTRHLLRNLHWNLRSACSGP